MTPCLHCHQEVIKLYENEAKEENGKTGPFCCQGCLTVYNIIHQKGLEKYYEIKNDTAFFKKRAPVELRSPLYSYLKDEHFLKEYSYLDLNNQMTMEFYLEGIHCLACLWILEKLPQFIPGVVLSKLNMGRSVLTVTIDQQGNFSEVAKELDNIGYRPHPLKINQDTNDFKIKEDRSMLLKIGIAGAASGNIMLYAISLYAGAGPEYQQMFNALTVFFAMPVLTYCAFPFYRNSYLALKNKSLSIDIPISLALIMGGVMAIYNLINHIPENYFDSLTALVFLLLLSRYFLKIIQEKGLCTSDLHFFYQGESVLKLDGAHLIEIHPKFIRENDQLKILPNQLIPADGQIISGESYLNNSLLTGESQLQKARPGDFVFSGTMNTSGELIVKVQKTHRETRLGKILRDVENGRALKAKIVDITNVVSKYFVAVVFLLATILFIWQTRSGDVESALRKALTLLIVTCPCALAIATPLTFIRTLSQAAKKGIIIKDDSVIEKLSQTKNIFIDKTGTITQGKLRISSFTLLAPVRNDFCLEDIIFNLEKYSLHPVAKSLKEWIELYPCQNLDVTDLMETPGMGISGTIRGHFYEIKNYTIYEDHQAIASFTTNDNLRADAFLSIKRIRDLGLNLKILSGDKKEFVKHIANELKLSEHEYAAELSPEDKNQIIRNSEKSLMIGDGANDAIALASADTGIAVFGAMDISLRAADIYLSIPGLSAVVDLIIISKETMKVIYRNLVLSLAYNSVSVLLAFTGKISPLTAAIIMPLSSLTVLISTLIGTKKLRALWK